VKIESILITYLTSFYHDTRPSPEIANAFLKVDRTC